MSQFKCEKCQKEFKTNGLFVKHHARKRPCAKEELVLGPAASVEGPNIAMSSFDQLKLHFNETLNKDKSTYKSSNDEPTPIECIEEMIASLPDEFWYRTNLRILDPCCGNGNFAIPVLFKLLETTGKTVKEIVENVLTFNDINQERLQNVERVFCADQYAANIRSEDFIASSHQTLYDLVMANPPYAKLLENGKRASKNHNLIKDFIEKALSVLKPGGYLMFITPDNWMSYADRNKLIEIITELQIVHLDIHSAKKYFKKIGSSFTWYIIQNRAAYKPITVSGLWKNQYYCGEVGSKKRKYIPLVYNNIVANILEKTVDNEALPKFQVKTSSDLHRYTKRDLISNDETPEFKHRLIHTPSQTVYASRPHKFQDGWKVFISTTDKYGVFVDNCGMTQSIVFIQCKNKADADNVAKILMHPLYVFVNNICRWGNFNNIRILQNFPVTSETDEKKIFEYFKITDEEIAFIHANL
jgi:tRNA1(Val) A37 N6-methylase TrmN6